MTEALSLEGLERRLTEIGGCSDGYCKVVRPKGMHTNGGCKCLRDPLKAERVVNAWKAYAQGFSPSPGGGLREALEKADAAWLVALLQGERSSGHCGEENAEGRWRRERNQRIDRVLAALTQAPASQGGA